MLVAERYRLIESIGTGGMGEVWRGVDEVLEREVAVKLLRPGREQVDTEGLTSQDRFRLEAQAAAKVNDPHVVTVHDFGTDDGRLYLVMEMVDGRSLSDELATVGVMEPALAASILAQAAAGLQAAHDHGIIHRDLKPANLLVAMDGTVKIADFGIARLVTHPDDAHTPPGEIAGTPNYLAPERAMGRPGSAFTDVYALGCVGYHLVTGRPPFTGDVAAAIAYQHIDVKPVPPHELQPRAGGELEDYLLRMLAKDPDDRPPMCQVAETMSELSTRYADAAADTDRLAVHRDRRLRRPVLVALVAATAVVTALLTVRFAIADVSPPAAMFVQPRPEPVPTTTPTPSRTPHRPSRRPVSTRPDPRPETVLRVDRTVLPKTRGSAKSPKTRGPVASPGRSKKAKPKKPSSAHGRPPAPKDRRPLR